MLIPLRGCHAAGCDDPKVILAILGIICGPWLLIVLFGYISDAVSKGVGNVRASRYDARVQARAQEFIKDRRKAEAEDKAAALREEEQHVKARRAGTAQLKAWSDKRYADICFRLDVKRRVSDIKAEAGK